MGFSPKFYFLFSRGLGDRVSDGVFYETSYTHCLTPLYTGSALCLSPDASSSTENKSWEAPAKLMWYIWHQNATLMSSSRKTRRKFLPGKTHFTSQGLGPERPPPTCFFRTAGPPSAGPGPCPHPSPQLPAGGAIASGSTLAPDLRQWPAWSVAPTLPFHSPGPLTNPPPGSWRDLQLGPSQETPAHPSP